MSARGWVVWTIGVLAYTSAVLQRTSLGVAGIEAAHRFHAPASIISTFVVLQLVVYAGCQVPVGVALDRFGTRKMVAVGAGVMAVGQVLMAFATDVPTAMAARVLVGGGDAMTFSSVIRLVPAWFPAKRVPLFTQVTGLLGQAGQIMAAIPLSMLLRGPGWSTGFGVAAAVAGTSCVLSALLLRNAPPGAPEPSTRVRTPLREDLSEVLGRPGTRLGFWTHMAPGFAPLVFAMMWGVPYLVQGEGRSPAFASTMLTTFVVLGLVIGPTMGVLTSRHPLRRSSLAIAVTLMNALPWVAIMLWPGPAPLWLLLVLVVGLAAGGPGSSIGFDFARTFNPAHRLGTATGVVIMGAFIAGFTAILGVGLVLDALRGPEGNTLGDYRWAMAVQLPIFAISLLGILRARRATRRRWHEEEGVVVPSWPEALQRVYGPWLRRALRR